MIIISVCILTKNSARSLPATLRSVKNFPEVVLLDTGSTDETCNLACTYNNAHLFKTPFTSFGILRNQAASLANNDWILAIDSDEVLSQELLDEIASLHLCKNTVYEIPFHNYFNKKRIYGCGWNPEAHVRLYHQLTTSFCESAVHEKILTEKCSVRRLRHPVLHTPYLNTADFLRKMQLYSDLFAKQYQGKRTSSFKKAFLHSLNAFFKSYFFKRGIFDGAEGFTISFYNAATTFYKYLKLSEANGNPS